MKGSTRMKEVFEGSGYGGKSNDSQSRNLWGCRSREGHAGGRNKSTEAPG